MGRRHLRMLFSVELPSTSTGSCFPLTFNLPMVRNSYSVLKGFEPAPSTGSPAVLCQKEHRVFAMRI